MTEKDELTTLTYEQKEKRFDEILGRLDRSETADGQFGRGGEGSGPANHVDAINLRSAKQEVATVFADMEKQKEAMGRKPKAD